MLATTDPSTRLILAETSPLLANMAALWAADAALAEEMESVLAMAAYPVELAKSGEATLALARGAEGRIYLHSRHRPREEAKKLIDSCDLEGKIVFAIHGFALGYH